MPGYDNSSRYSEIRPVALGTAGVVLVLVGALLLDQAFSSATFGRLIIRSWVSGVVGLMFVIPGTVVIGFTIERAWRARRHRLLRRTAEKTSNPSEQA